MSIDLRTSTPDEVPAYMITLVHGTIFHLGPIRIFGNTPWIREGSLFRNTLSKYLGRSAHFSIFEWTGHNSHAARVAAADRLALVLLGQLAALPTARHIVVGHSHGGNVALYAAR